MTVISGGSLYWLPNTEQMAPSTPDPHFTSHEWAETAGEELRQVHQDTWIKNSKEINLNLHELWNALAMKTHLGTNICISAGKKKNS